MSKAYAKYMEESYFAGTLCLISSLNHVGSRYPIVVMCPATVSDSMVAYLNSLAGVTVVFVEDIEVNESITRNNMDNNQSKWTNTFSKLRVFDLVGYSKLVF